MHSTYFFRQHVQTGCPWNHPILQRGIINPKQSAQTISPGHVVAILERHHIDPVIFSVATCQSQSASLAWSRRPPSEQRALAMIPVGQGTTFLTCQQTHLPMAIFFTFPFRNLCQALRKALRFASSDLLTMEWSNLKAQFFPTLLIWCMGPLWPK